MPKSEPIIPIIVVTCTKCGRLQLDAGTTAAPDECPKCGASGRYHNDLPDYIAEPWEEIDVTPRMWGVFGAEDHLRQPIAIFSSEDLARGWVTWQESLGDDGFVGNGDSDVVAVQGLTGHAWNSYKPPPAVDS